MSSSNKTQHTEFNPSKMTPDEILAKAKDEGYELTEEQLEGIAGGGMWDKPAADGCPKCGSHDISYSNIGQTMHFKCNKCGYKWC